MNELRFINHKFPVCLHCCAHYIKDCVKKIKDINGDKLPKGCWRNTPEYCVIKDSPNYKTEDVQ